MKPTCRRCHLLLLLALQRARRNLHRQQQLWRAARALLLLRRARLLLVLPLQTQWTCAAMTSNSRSPAASGGELAPCSSSKQQVM
jgi:hypothetical protein